MPEAPHTIGTTEQGGVDLSSTTQGELKRPAAGGAARTLPAVNADIIDVSDYVMYWRDSQGQYAPSMALPYVPSELPMSALSVSSILSSTPDLSSCSTSSSLSISPHDLFHQNTLKSGRRGETRNSPLVHFADHRSDRFSIAFYIAVHPSQVTPPNIFPTLSQRVSILEINEPVLQHHCYRFFHTRASARSWLPTLFQDFGALLSLILVSSSHQIAVDGNPKPTVLILLMREEVCNRINVAYKNPRTRRNATTVMMITQLLLTDIINVDDSEWHRHEEALRHILRELEICKPYSLYAGDELPGLVVISCFTSALLRGVRPGSIFTTFADGLREMSYHEMHAVPESPLFCPGGQFKILQRSNLCLPQTLQLIRDVQRLTDLASRMSVKSTWATDETKSETLQRVTNLPSIVSSSKADGVSGYGEASWRYEACRLSAIIQTSALASGKPIWDCLKPTALSETTEALVTAIQKTAYEELWGEMAGVLYWITFIGAAAARGQPQGRFLRAAHIQCCYSLAFEHRFAILLTLRRTIRAFSHSLVSGPTARLDRRCAEGELTTLSPGIKQGSSNETEAMAEAEDQCQSDPNGDTIERPLHQGDSSVPSTEILERPQESGDSQERTSTEKFLENDEEPALVTFPAIEKDIVGTTVTQRKREIVDRLMELFEEMVAGPDSPYESSEDFSLSPETEFSFVSEATYESGSAEDSNGSLQQDPSDAGAQDKGESSARYDQDKDLVPPSLSTKQSWKRKRFDQQGGNGNDEDEDGRDSKRPYRQENQCDQTKPRRFACPYYKRNMNRQPKKTSCVLPGFPTISRMKEHLYRTHPLPIKCQRCYEDFENGASLREHLRKPPEQMCVQASPIPDPEADGFDKEQEERLRCKRRTNGTEEDKWRATYRILFPQDLESSIPSPYWEERITSPSSRDLMRYEDFSRRTLPLLVRQDLESAVDNRLGDTERDLTSELPDIIRRCQERMFALFREQIASNGGLRSSEDGEAIVDSSEAPPGPFAPTSDHSLSSTARLPASSAVDSANDVLAEMLREPPHTEPGIRQFTVDDVPRRTEPSGGSERTNPDDSGYGSQQTFLITSSSREDSNESAQLVPSLAVDFDFSAEFDWGGFEQNIDASDDAGGGIGLEPFPDPFDIDSFCYDSEIARVLTEQTSVTARNDCLESRFVEEQRIST